MLLLEHILIYNKVRERIMNETIDFLKPENRLRATPLDLLKQGIVQREWEAIDAGYVMLTGQPIPAQSNDVKPLLQKMNETVKPKAKRGRPRKVKVEEPHVNNEISMQMGVPSDCVAPATNGKHQVPSRRQAITERRHTNKWKDDGSEAADEIVKDRQVPAAILNNRRPDMPWIKIRCTECGKVEPGSWPGGGKLTKSYTMKYKCNTCACGAASERDIDDDEVIEDDE
jgi:hypothetical protein